MGGYSGGASRSGCRDQIALDLAARPRSNDRWIGRYYSRAMAQCLRIDDVSIETAPERPHMEISDEMQHSFLERDFRQAFCAEVSLSSGRVWLACLWSGTRCAGDDVWPRAGCPRSETRAARQDR